MALDSSTFSNAGGAVSDLFAGFGHLSKAEGDRAEASNYRLAAGLADKNEKFTETSTALKTMQAGRDLYKSMGQTQADVAGAGFAESGSALDILRDSASQGALTRATLSEQGLITEAGYKEQSDSYHTMADAADKAANAEDMAGVGSFITGAIKGIAAVASVALAPVTGGASLFVGAALAGAMAGGSGGG